MRVISLVLAGILSLYGLCAIFFGAVLEIGGEKGIGTVYVGLACVAFGICTFIPQSIVCERKALYAFYILLALAIHCLWLSFVTREIRETNYSYSQRMYFYLPVLVLLTAPGSLILKTFMLIGVTH